MYYSLADVPRSKRFFELSIWCVLDCSLGLDLLADRDRLPLLIVPDLLDLLAFLTLVFDADFSMLLGADLFALSSHSCDCW